MASLFHLAGPDLIIILLIVLLLFGARRLPDLMEGMRQALRGFFEEMNADLRTVARGSDESAERRGRGEKFAAFNRVMGVFVALAALLLLSVLLSRQ